jgi:hypothetical protein
MANEGAGNPAGRVLPAIDIECLRDVRLTYWKDRDPFIGGAMPDLVRECWVYFVQGDDGGPVKIGRTENWPGQRLTDLQLGYPFGWLRVVGLMRGKFGLEKQIHRQFHSLRMRGEWFRADAELCAFIEQLPEQG